GTGAVPARADLLRTGPVRLAGRVGGAVRGRLGHLQWDPERSLRGAGLPYSSIQVGLSRHAIREFAEEWIVGVEDYTARARKIYDLLHHGQADKAKRQLPSERMYPVSDEIAEGADRLIDVELWSLLGNETARPDPRGGDVYRPFYCTNMR